MHSRNTRSKESSGSKKGSKSTGGEIPPECLEDPKFLKVLATALSSEIASLELLVNEADAEIEGYKKNVSKGLEERKRLKEFIRILTDKKTALSTALESLDREGRLRSITVATMKLGLDDATQRDIADRANYKKILLDYEETWQEYQDAYEERPWAKERQRVCVTLKQQQLRLMMAEYEKESLKKMLEQRKKIDTIRVRVSITEMSEKILQRWKEQKHVDDLNTVAKQLQTELDYYTAQLTQLKRDEEERKRMAEIETAMMPPPTLDFSFMRSTYHEERNLYKRNHPKFTPTRDSDAESINTLMLEEMCSAPINDEPVAETWEEDNQIPEGNEDESRSSNPIVLPVEKTLIDSYATKQLTLQTKQMKQLPTEETQTFDNEQKQRQARSEKKNNHDNVQEEVSEFEGGPVEDAHQRTRRWCENAQDKLVPFSLVRQRSNSFNDLTKDGLMNERYDKSVAEKFGKASSICGSETASLYRQQGVRKNYDKAAMEITEELSEDISLENFVSNISESEKIRRQNSIAVETFRSRERELPTKISSPAVKTPISKQHIYETPELKRPVMDDNIASQESKTMDDNSELLNDVSCSRPKIRKIETVNFQLKQGTKNTVSMNEHRPLNPVYSTGCPSPTGSSLSAMYTAAMRETQQAFGAENFGGERVSIPEFPSLSNFRNWSPPNSERSFASSISKIGPNKDDDSIKKQNQEFDFGGFFCMQPTQNTGKMF